MINNKWVQIQASLFVAVMAVLLTSCQNKAVKSVDKTVIPATCISSGFELVYTLVSSKSYNEKRAAYYPIISGNGSIKRDFNNDGLSDYVFLEQKIGASGAMLKACISDKKQASSYQPRKTTIQFREFRDADLYVESGEVTFNHGELVISYGSHAHNDGGQYTHKIYAFEPKKNNFILKGFEYHGYGDAYGDEFYRYDLKKKTYHSNTKCTFPNYWGGDISGCKAQIINRCLTSAGAGYSMLLGKGVNEAILKSMVVDCK